MLEQKSARVPWEHMFAPLGSNCPDVTPNGQYGPMWPHVAPYAHIYIYIPIYIYICIYIYVLIYIYIYIYTPYKTHYHIVPTGGVTQTQPCTPEIRNATESTLDKKQIGNISWSSQYTLCTVPPPIVPLREQAGRPKMRRCYLPIGLPNQTERAHNIGDNSVLFMGVQSYRDGTQNWR